MTDIFEIEDEFIFCDEFLKNVYNINNFSDAQNFVKLNPTLNYYTLGLVLNCIHRVYLDTPEYPIPEIIEHYKQICEKLYNKKITADFIKTTILNLKHKTYILNFDEYLLK
jgi:hypothetical protein